MASIRTRTAEPNDRRPGGRRLRSLGALSVFALAGASTLGAQTVITVTTAADSGAGSLREAIATANTDAVPTTIDFAGGLAGSTIALLSQLPDLTEGGTTIDGDLGADCDPDVGLDGSAAGGGADGLAFTSDDNVVRGLAIFDFSGDGIHVEGSNNVVECSSIGTDLALASGHGNGGHGIHHVAGSDNRFGPTNTIAHNGGAGVPMSEQPMPGAYPEFTSLVADAVEVFPVLDFTSGPDGSFQSTDAIRPTDGSGAPFLDTFGMRLSGTATASAAGTYTLTLSADNQARLLVDDVEVASVDHDEVAVGVALSGVHAIEVDYLEGCGGAAATVSLAGPGAVTFTTDGAIGGACAGSQAGLCGELFQIRVPSEGNTVTESSIFGNGELGIDLAHCGGAAPTLNDAGDLDEGPNTLLNYPEITGVTYAGAPGSYTVSGTAPADSTVELFVSDEDSSGYGEGGSYLATVVATGGGTFSGSVTLDPGDRLTATATDANGNTSEFGPNFAAGDGADQATVGSDSAFPGASFEIPISVRDLSLTALGLDRPAGEKIQSLSFKVVYAPTGSFASITAARAGITAGLAPAFESTPSTTSSRSYIGQFDEGTNPIPFTLGAAAPGDQVAKLTVTLAANAPPGTISLTLDTTATSLANAAGTIEETDANGALALTNGAITVLSNAARGLYAQAISSSEIELRWSDPDANETDFRIERSTDGSSWSTVTTVGPDTTSYTDSGRSPATLYYYRLVTLIPADSQLSNVGFATTFPASAAKVCVQRLPGMDATYAVWPSAAWNDVDEEWAVVWQAREDGVQDDIFFQRLDSATLAPIGGAVNVSANEMPSIMPTLSWNGSSYLVAWYEHRRREPGTLPGDIGPFAVLAPDGTVVRRGVWSPDTSVSLSLNDDRKTPLSWDGTHWGYLSLEETTPPYLDVFYRRLSENADVVLGPTSITSTAGHWETNRDLAYNSTLGKHGAAWTRQIDESAEPFFQRFEESTGATEGSAESLGTPFFATYGLSTISNGADGWAVAWTENDGSEYATYFRKIDASGVPIGAGKVRLSDAAPAFDFLPSLHPRPDGGFVVFSAGYGPGGSAYEVMRAEADSSGAKDGPVVVISPDDGKHSYLPAVAEDGSRFLVVWNEADPSGSPNGLEVAGLLVDADGLSSPGSKVDLTTGHTPNTLPFEPSPGSIGVQPLGAGFVALWTDPAHPGEIRGRSWDGSGTTESDFLPLNTAPLAGTASMVAVGDSFAVLWRTTAAGDFRFARYDASGALTGEAGIASAANSLVLGFDGESYVAFGRSGSNFVMKKIDFDGNEIGSEVVVAATSGQAPRLVWTGGGWALFWRGPGPDPGLRFQYVSPDGAVITPATVIAAPYASYAINQFAASWNGAQLGIAWSQRKAAANPPGAEVYYTTLGLDGTKAFPETAVVSSPHSDLLGGFGNLYWSNGAFHLVFQGFNGSGFREMAIDPDDGTVVSAERFLSNREGGATFAWNGVTLGMAWHQNRLAAQHFQTDACLDDPSPPACPALSVASVGGVPRLTWPAVSDAQSGIWRYQVLRDGIHLAELGPATLAFDDEGYDFGTTHSYELLAMNGAYQESEGCAPVAFSTTAGDASGDGAFDIGDLFYLINFFFGDGAPPAGDADANGDGAVTVADLFYLINHFFSGGPPPV